MTKPVDHLMRPAPTLPPKSTRLERALVLTNAALDDLPVNLRDLWNPDTCPPAFLPHLAWAWSVDRWDHHWPEAMKRSVIKASFYIHRHKGTVAAVRRVIESFGYRFGIVEWWNMTPPGIPGTFALDVAVLDKGITDTLFVEMERLVDDAKPCSRHLTGLRLHLQVDTVERIGVTAYLGDVMTVYPYSPDPISVDVHAADGIRVHVADTLTVQPLH